MAHETTPQHVYPVTYYDADGGVVVVTSVQAGDDLSACSEAWRVIPGAADDFNVDWDGAASV